MIAAVYARTSDRLVLAHHLRWNAAVLGAPDMPLPLRITVQPTDLPGGVYRVDNPTHMAGHQTAQHHQVIECPDGGIPVRVHAPGAP